MCFGSKPSADQGAAGPRPVPLSPPGNSKPSATPSATWAGPGTAPSRPEHQPQNQEYSAPPGPPPGHAAGPPPQPSYDEAYAPPSGPPPSHTAAAAAAASTPSYAPPAGPPPGHHDWQSAVPDTALLPPPPALFAGWDRSPASNAPEEQSVAGEAWCERYPLQFPPMDLRDNAATRLAIANCATALQRPPTFRGTLQQPQEPGGSWSIASARGCPDACLVGFPPSYAPSLHSPVGFTAGGGVSGRSSFAAYYEVHVQSPNSTGEVTLAMGFTAMPYPPFRMPGWHRGSLAVHGDDGHRYINDTWGGKTLREGFAMKAGGTYGIGMRFTQGGGGGLGGSKGGLDVQVFFTVEGRLFADWDIHEETDAEQDRPVTGLEGFHDLSIAVGVFDNVAAEVRPHPSQWLYGALKQEKLAEIAALGR